MNKMESEKVLTFEFITEEKILIINLNKEGIFLLIDKLNELINNQNEQDHTHLMTSSWGGKELSEIPQCSKSILINHVKINKWK